MKKRYIYSLLYGIPGLGISFLAAVLVAGMTMGFFWLFMFGDTMEWPSWTEWVAPTLAIIAFVIMQSVIVMIGYNTGKKQEANNLPINRKHIIIPLLILVFFIFYMIVISRNSDSNTGVCRDMCVQKGYNTDGLSISSDGTCRCYDSATQTSYEAGVIK